MNCFRQWSFLRIMQMHTSRKHKNKEDTKQKNKTTIQKMHDKSEKLIKVKRKTGQVSRH